MSGPGSEADCSGVTMRTHVQINPGRALVNFGQTSEAIECSLRVGCP